MFPGNLQLSISHLQDIVSIFLKPDTFFFADKKPSLTASYSSSVAEECVCLLRSLHALPGWSLAINQVLSDTLDTAEDVLHLPVSNSLCVQRVSRET